MQLVIAEKPSVAQSLASILGVSTRHDGYMEGKKYIVSWCFGHLAGLADADVYDTRYAKWKMEDLPIIPSSFQFRIAEGKQNQSVARLVQGKTLIVIAHRLSTITDADQIVVVNNGQIAGTGTHEILLNTCALYKQLWEAHISTRDGLEGGSKNA